jgi:RNA polymerase sigma-70 factor (ECF subfamily)
MEYQSDQYYISQVLAGNLEAFEPLVQQYQDMVFTIVNRISGRYHDAEELAQDVFLKAFQNLHRFEGKSRFSTWLYRIAYNTAITHKRKKKMVYENMDETLTANYSDEPVHEDVFSLNQEERHRFGSEVLSSLPEEEYVLIMMFYKEAHTIKDLAEITGLQPNHVKVKLHRIRKKMQKQLEKLMSENLIEKK